MLVHFSGFSGGGEHAVEMSYCWTRTSGSQGRELLATILPYHPLSWHPAGHMAELGLAVP